MVVLGLAMPAATARVAEGILVGAVGGVDAQREPTGETEGTARAVAEPPRLGNGAEVAAR